MCAGICRKMAAAEKVLRVSQLDVVEFDEELLLGFESRFVSIFQHLPSFAYFIRIKPELKASLRLFIWWCSVHKTGNTLSQEMLRLGYYQNNDIFGSVATQGSPSLLTRYLLLSSVILGWIQDRFDNIIQLFSFTQSLNTERIKVVINSIIQFACCLNFCSFLLHGIYPSLKERLLRLQMVPLARQTLRQPSYEFLNREIIWYGFSEFLFFVLPQINFFALRNYFKKKLASFGMNTSLALFQTSSPNKCAHCESLPILPQVVSECGHVFCYYCIAANLKADKDYPCDICGAIVADFKHAVYR